MPAVTCPEGTVADGGTIASPGSSLVRVIVVGEDWVMVMVAVSVPMPPSAIGSVGGRRLVSVGGGTVPYRVSVRRLPGGLVRRT
jgi:hypothetical protein